MQLYSSPGSEEISKPAQQAAAGRWKIGRMPLQIFLTLIAGFGIPSAFYVAFDQLDSDISWPSYIGIVTVMTIAGVVLWIENLLAFFPVGKISWRVMRR